MNRSFKNKVFIIIILIAALTMSVPYALAGSVGVIMTGDIQYYRDIHKVFLDEISGLLKEKGHEIVLQKPMPDPMSWVNAAKKLVTIGSEIIVAYGVPATLITMKETSDIPIIFAGVFDPENLKITGKNATGTDSQVSIEDVLKKLNSIRKVSKLGVVFNKSEKDTILQVKKIKKLEGTYGFKSVLINVKKKINKSKIAGIDALIITTSSSCMKSVKDIVEAARTGRILTAALIGGGEKAGVILTVSVDPGEQGKEVAAMVTKVLGGSKPADMPVVKPKKTAVAINLKEASAIGIEVPADIQSKATEVIK